MGQGERWTEAQRAARYDKLVERNRLGNAGPRNYEDAGWMRDAYEVRGLSLRAVAAEAECSLRTVARWLEVHGIPARPTGTHEGKSGEAHYKWKGGIPPCRTCGKPMPHRQKGQHCEACRPPRDGAQNSNFRGGLIGYPQAHGRVVKLRGKASAHLCRHCAARAQDWAYDHADADELRSDEGPYSLEPNHYMPLCKSCHKRFDYKARANESAARVS